MPQNTILLFQQNSFLIFLAMIFAFSTVRKFQGLVSLFLIHLNPQKSNQGFIPRLALFLSVMADVACIRLINLPYYLLLFFIVIIIHQTFVSILYIVNNFINHFICYFSTFANISPNVTVLFIILYLFNV